MAINIPIITEFSDAGLKSAQGAFNQFKTKIGEAEGAMGKLRAGSNVAFDAIKANAGAMALGAGAAIATFAAKAIGDFRDLALEVDKFSDVTGLAAEDASRWVEVAGDMGIESGVVEASINRMNREIANGSKEFEKLGIEIVRTSDGAVDVNETFLNTVQALKDIKDPAERARVAAQLLGKGWTGMAELVQAGSDELRASLDSVADAKIIDEREIEKAKRLREVQDNLADTVEVLALTLGETLLPALVTVLGPFEKLGVAMQQASEEGINLSDGPLTILAKKLGIIDDEQEAVNDTMEDAWKGYYQTRRQAQTLTEAMGDQIEATQRLEEGWADLLGKIDEREAWRNLQDRLTEADQKIAEVFGQNTPAAMLKAEGAIDDQIVAIARYVDFMEDEIPDFIETKILAALDQGQIDEARRLLEIKFGQPIYQDIIPNPLIPGQISRFMFVDSETDESGRRIPVPRRRRRSETQIAIDEVRRERIPNLMGASNYSAAVVVNVAGSVISQGDLVETVRKGLVNSQRNGAQLIYQNT